MNSVLPDSIREELYRLSFVSTGYSSPNPPVACILENANTGEILSAASTRQTGGNHAEREAYRILREKIPTGILPAHNVYVTLEPCSHFGKTPPCTDLLLAEKPLRLFYGWKDPNPMVKNNSGLSRLEEAGIQVFQNPELEKIAASFVFGFRSRMEKNRPSFLLKTSVSKEGHFTSGTREREKISGPESDLFLCLLRAKVDAVLVGPKTVEVDLPSLDFRLPEDLSKYLQNLSSTSTSSLNAHSGFAGLLSEVLHWGKDPEILKIHLEKQKDYQPLRVFFLPPENRIPSEFLEKQEKINEKNGRNSSAFFLDVRNSYSAGLKDSLVGLSDSRIAIYSDGDFAKSAAETLSNWGVNLALIEGGNFLYKNFSRIFSKGDSILSIRSKEVSLPKGILPEWEGEFSMEWKANFGPDEWEVLESCSLDL